MKENQDLLDLCRLNLMEETAKYSPANDRDTTMEAIDWEKRQLVIKMLSEPVDVTQEVVDQHITTQTLAQGDKEVEGAGN